MVRENTSPFVCLHFAFGGEAVPDLSIADLDDGDTVFIFLNNNNVCKRSDRQISVDFLQHIIEDSQVVTSSSKNCSCSCISPLPCLFERALCIEVSDICDRMWLMARCKKLRLTQLLSEVSDN